VRWALGAAILAVAGAVYLLVVERSDPRPPQKPPRNGPPVPPANGGNGEPGGGLPDPAQDPAGFADGAARHGEVAPLLEFLRSGEDQQLALRWTFDADGNLVGHPTLRATYIVALGRIDSAEATGALQEVLQATESVEEAYVLVQALSARGAPGWAAAALERGAARGLPVQRPVQLRLVNLAAVQDPALTAQFMVEKAPRGEDASVPRILAEGLAALPIGHATSTVEALVTDKAVTNRARAVYLKALCARQELDAIRALTGLAERRELDERTAIEACYAAAGARALDLDRLAQQRALAEGNAAAAAEARDRHERRRAEIRVLIQAALGFDVDTSDDPRASALKRLLDRS
jgi:hypothetical protein